MFRKLVIVMPIALIAAGCTEFGPADVAKPGAVTVEEAMASIGKGFSEMQKNLHDGGIEKIGVIACKVSVNFNVSAAAGQDHQLVLDMKISPGPTIQPIVSGEAGANASFAETASATRGNTVQIEMLNPACLPKDTLGYQSPDKLKDVYDAINEESVTLR